MNLDLSKFKKIESNDKHTTLKHPSGHTIKIAKQGLSKEMIKQLEELPVHLAKGGFSGPSKNSRAAPSSAPVPEAVNNFTEPKDMGTHKAPSMGEASFHDGGQYPPCKNPSCKSFGRSHPNCKCYGGYAEGGMAEGYCSKDNPHKEGCEYYAFGTPLGAGAEEMPPAETPAAEQTPAPSLAPTPSPQMAEAAPEPAPEQSLNPNPEMAAKPEQAAAPEQPSAPEQPKTPMQTFDSHKQAATQQLYPEAQAFKADLDNGHITPETYKSLFDKKDTLGKVGTIFGLLLGGMGSGLTHQPNALLSMMQKQIDNDLDAQQKSVGNKQNFLKINQQNLMNQASIKSLDQETKSKAFALAKVQMNWAALHKLTQDTMKLPDGPQKQQALQTLAMMNQGVQNENFGIMDRAATASALSKTMFGDQGNQPNTTAMKSGLMGPEAKEAGADIEEKTLPGIPSIAGQRAARPLPQATRDQAQAMTVLDDKGKDLLNYIHQNTGTWNPQKRAKATQKLEEMKNFYNESIRGGALTEGRLGWYDEQFKKNPTDILPQLLGSTAKLKEMVNSNAIRRDTLLKSSGFHPKSSGQTAQAETPQGNVSKSGRQIEYKNGKAFYK